MNDKKGIFSVLLFVLGLLIIMFLIFYFTIDILYSTGNTTDNKKIKLNSKYDNPMYLDDGMPMSDNSGKKITYKKDNSDVVGYYEFEITSKSSSDSNYEIYAVEEDVDNRLKPNYVKVYLTDEDDNPVSGYDNISVPTYGNLKVSSLNPAGRRLYYGYLEAGESKKYKLRVWVSDAYTVTKTTKEFGMKLYVEVD